MEKITKIIAVLAVCVISTAVFAQESSSLLKPVNDLNLGTFSGHAQLLYSDLKIDGLGSTNGEGNANSTTLGLKLDYVSPTFAGLTLSLSYIDTEVLGSGGGAFDTGKAAGAFIGNGGFSILNEAYISYNAAALGLEKTTLIVGRKVLDTEVMTPGTVTAWQKERSYECAVMISEDIQDTVLILGHLERMSNVWATDDAWKFGDLSEDLLGLGWQTRGVEYFQTTYNGIANMEIAVYDAYLHDIMNVAGTRIKYDIDEALSLNVWYKHECSIQEIDNLTDEGKIINSNLYSASLTYAAENFTIEPGFVIMGGNTAKGTALVNQTTLGFNHPLAETILYTDQWNGGADTYFVKVDTKIGKTSAYLLAAYTNNDSGVDVSDGYEIDLMVSRPIVENLDASVKLAYARGDSSVPATDDVVTTLAQVYLTYTF
ncbi:MAG: hypothetical protein U9O87_05585 [Verrucomicrobiota bacterium]|nr:hypothetical protein [Verrucomicrobiota bacterium]